MTNDHSNCMLINRGLVGDWQRACPDFNNDSDVISLRIPICGKFRLSNKLQVTCMAKTAPAEALDANAHPIQGWFNVYSKRLTGDRYKMSLQQTDMSLRWQKTGTSLTLQGASLLACKICSHCNFSNILIRMNSCIA